MIPHFVALQEDRQSIDFRMLLCFPFKVNVKHAKFLQEKWSGFLAIYISMLCSKILNQILPTENI